MNLLLYITKHCFVEYSDGSIYSVGMMGPEYFEKYLGTFDKVIVVGYKQRVNSKNIKKTVGLCVQNTEHIQYKLAYCKNMITKYLIANKDIRAIVHKCAPQSCAVICKTASGTAFAVRTAQKHKLPYMVEVVSCPWDALWNHSLKGKLLAPFMWLLTRNRVKNAPYALYVTNEFLQKRYPCNGVTVGCSDVALPPLDKEILDKRINKINAARDNDPIILGTTAAVNVRYKGQEYVIRAIAKLCSRGYNFEYHLVGGGDNSYLKSVAESCGVTDRIKFLGSLPHQEVFEYLDNIDIYVQPSKQEGLPRALAEAMSRGCPAIGSTTGGIPELLDSDFIFKNGAVDEICRLLENVNKNILLEQADRNFEKAKEYDSLLLDRKRADFLEKFKREITVND